MLHSTTTTVGNGLTCATLRVEALAEFQVRSNNIISICTQDSSQVRYDDKMATSALNIYNS
jgi:hypothetical protein